ncbi:ComF family protein [Methylocucumis oryzae]|uniref:Phosphoribosyltransferase n=1 Tax=Methylocucumis oryzae TaxID=1632867 RepID=A0A0F3IL69_9GAMM|nr:ComF family protein [Methylocucumis oryzae]KJV06304.1 phosphoribosyltransferase [Methylocucumis oryzae]
MGYNWLNIIQNYLLPPTCVLCGHEGFLGRDLCEYCYRDLARNLICCSLCARPLATNESGLVCGECLRLTPAFDKTLAPFLYQDAMQLLITQLKFGGDFKNARILGQLLAEHIPGDDLPELILPVPLHGQRYRERGFNQALEIARIVATELKLPIDFYSCKRNRPTEQQTQLTAKKRRQNIKHAFSVVKPLPAKHIALLDDVMTTGATADELTKTLKNQGVERVELWVCARAWYKKS